VRHARLAITLLTASWLVLLAAAPIEALGAPVSGVVYAFGSLICHQRAERSFHLGMAQLPVCARCFGLYLGAAIGAFAALKGGATSLPWGRGSGLRATIAIAAIPTALTWGGEVAGLWQPSNVTRFVAALPLGTALALTVNYLECARPPRNGSSPQQTRI
jgi:uncharacterized membrane protein